MIPTPLQAIIRSLRRRLDNMNKQSCHFCGSDNLVLLAEETRIANMHPCSIVKCTGCGLMCRNPVDNVPSFDDEYIEELDKYYRLEEEEQTSIYQDKIERIESFIKIGNILDVGCSRGFFLNYVESRGWIGVGLEPVCSTAQYAREQFGLEIINQSIEEASLPKEEFDVIHMNHVLEHVLNPKQCLRNCRRALKIDGILAIEVPNEFASIIVPLRRFLGRSLPAYPVPSAHRYFFRPKTLINLIQNEGFRIIHVRVFNRIFDRPDIASGLLKDLIKKSIRGIDRMLGKLPYIEVFATRKL